MFLAIRALLVGKKEALRRGWIKEPLHVKVKSVEAQYDQKQPYSDDEVDALLGEAAS